MTEPIESNNDGDKLTMEDTFKDPGKLEDIAELNIDSQKLYRYAKEELDDRERMIICKRYGLNFGFGAVTKPMTQIEVAKYLGISRSYVSRIEKKALTKLRARFDGKDNRRDRNMEY